MRQSLRCPLSSACIVVQQKLLTTGVRHNLPRSNVFAGKADPLAGPQLDVEDDSVFAVDN